VCEFRFREAAARVFSATRECVPTTVLIYDLLYSRVLTRETAVKKYLTGTRTCTCNGERAMINGERAMINGERAMINGE
jgi:hypothetical protein